MAIYAHGKVSQAYTLRFPCRSKTTGLLLSGETTFTVKVRKADETLLTPDPSVTELTTDSALGEYKLSFTPDSSGWWSVKISQASMYDIYVDIYVESLQIEDVAPASTALSTATWTGTKAGYLDAAISSRAPSSTALDNTVWTNAKAAFVDAAISSRLDTASYTAPDNASITAIKAKTDNLPADPASDTTVNTRAPAATALSTAQWTNTRAGNLDNLDAAISTRAAAATALSTAQWTNLRASNLDNLDAAISTRLATASYTAPDNTTIGTINTKLGTPAGASVSADIAAVKSDTGSIKSTVDTNLDATVSSRAAASTALDNTIWTNTKAGYIDAAISSRLASGSYTSPPTTADIADAVWDEAIAGHTTVGSTGYTLNNAGGGSSPADIADAVWDELTSGHATSGSFGKLLTDNIDATISSRLATVGYTAPDNSTISTINTKIGTPSVSVSSDIAGVKSDTSSVKSTVDTNLNATISSRAAAATALDNTIWTNTKAGYIDAAVSTRLASASYTAPDNTSITAIKAKTDNLPADPASDTTVNTRAPASTALSTVQWTNTRAGNLDNLDATVSSRLASGSYTAPDNTSITAIKAKTDNLPADPASDTTVNTRAPASTALSTAQWTNLRASNLDNLDATVSTRLPTSSYTAPDNSSITAIKSKTDNLPADPASTTNVNTRLAAVDYVAPNNALISTIDTKIGTPVSTVSADIAAVQTDVDSISSAITLKLDVAVSTRLAASSYVAPDNSGVTEAVTQATLARKYAGNKAILDPDTAILTVYDDDNTTPILEIRFTDDEGNPSVKKMFRRTVL